MCGGRGSCTVEITGHFIARRRTVSDLKKHNNLVK
jgi:hypothetical protein